MAMSALFAACGTLAVLIGLTEGCNKVPRQAITLGKPAIGSLCLIGWALFDQGSAPALLFLKPLKLRQLAAIWVLVTLAVLALMLAIRHLPNVAMLIVSPHGHSSRVGISG